MRPAVESCPYREALPWESGPELARCRLIESVLGEPARCAPIPREVCAACCRSTSPSPERWNEVIGSLLVQEAGKLRQAGGLTGCSLQRAEAVLRQAEAVLQTHWGEPNHARWSGRVPGLELLSAHIDDSITCDTLAEHLRRGEPFAHLRYSDGEWLSILGHSGRNVDGHDFFPHTMGPELGETLRYWASFWPHHMRFYLGLQTVYYVDPIRRYLVEQRLCEAIHWVRESLYSLGLRDRSTLRFLEAVQAYPGLKILVGNAGLEPVARGLRCRHVVIPPTDCYLVIGRLISECRFSGPGLVVCCAGMAAECLLTALHRFNPDGTYVDCGHIFDIFIGKRSRDYTQANSDGIVEFLFDQYAPVLFRDASFAE